LAWNDDAAIKAGQALYQDSCAICHGQSAKGGLPNTPDFSSTQVSADLKANAGRYFCAVTKGKGGMPAFEKSLSSDERWQLIIYLRSVGP
jgi:mono/diheme cytochrome c family protein